jgi:Cu+-exporting ATPase
MAALEKTERRSFDTSWAQFGIDGMTYASCVRRVERAIAAVHGIQAANVNLATEQIRAIAPIRTTTSIRCASCAGRATSASPWSR